MPKENDYLFFEDDMGTGSILRIFLQGDGDVVLAIYDPEKGMNGGTASIEFCTPMMGGGRHERLWRNLAEFFKSEMEELDKLENTK